MDQINNVSVVLPSLDPDEKLLAVIDGLLEYGFADIILVNDGSKPENLHFFETAAANPQVTLLHHPKNLGKGAALKTAFRWFLENRPDSFGVVTVDGDNQHHPSDTRACTEHMLQSGHLTLGVRDFSLPHVPFKSRNGNRITSLVFKLFVGMTISDTQTGLRAIPANCLELFCNVFGDRFEYETNMLLSMKENGIIFDEVKIQTVYIEENKSSHFRAFRDSWRIYKLILSHFFKYTASSLLCALVDQSVFTLLAAVLPGLLSGFLLTAIPAALARVCSSVLNFALNKKYVFRSDCPVKVAFLRYYALAIPVMALQILLTHGVYILLGIPETAVALRAILYGVVMIALFLLSFTVQKRWVFSKSPNRNEDRK